MARYKKQPLIIEAVQYDGMNALLISIELEMPEYGEELTSSDMLIPTLEGEMRASVGDYIIKGVEGEFYPCKPSVFENPELLKN